MHRVPLRYIQKLGCVLLNRYFSEPSRGFSKGSHALAEAGREASATSEEATLRGGAEKARYAAARRPSQRRITENSNTVRRRNRRLLKQWHLIVQIMLMQRCRH